MANVLLLREPSQDHEDRYEALFKQAGFNPISIPVLETVLCHISELTNCLHSATENGISGVIITSKRSCEAIGAALQTSRDLGRDSVDNWKRLRFYVVGESTASSLRDILRSMTPELPDIQGQHCGNAENLASFIEDLLGQSAVKLLYLTGDKNRDTLTRKFENSNVKLVPLQVYETRTSSVFHTNLKGALEANEGNNIWWLMFFAPSAAISVIPTLSRYFRFKRLEPRDSSVNPNISAKIGTIGPTTKAALQDELGLVVDAMAQKPSPECLVASIVEYRDNL